MLKSFRRTILAIGAVFLASSLTLAAQTSTPPTGDGAAPAPKHHAKTGKTRKHSGKKGARKKAGKKSPATTPK